MNLKSNSIKILLLKKLLMELVTLPSNIHLMLHLWANFIYCIHPLTNLYDKNKTDTDKQAYVPRIANSKDKHQLHFIIIIKRQSFFLELGLSLILFFYNLDNHPQNLSTIFFPQQVSDIVQQGIIKMHRQLKRPAR